MMYRRQRKRNKLSHADDWLMTYADMITLLLCFFVVAALASISQKKTDAAQKVETAAQAPKPIEAQQSLPDPDETIKPELCGPVEEKKTEKSDPPNPG